MYEDRLNILLKILKNTLFTIYYPLFIRYYYYTYLQRTPYIYIYIYMNRGLLRRLHSNMTHRSYGKIYIYIYIYMNRGLLRRLHSNMTHRSYGMEYMLSELFITCLCERKMDQREGVKLEFRGLVLTCL
jgi:hypothetical protein